MKKLLNFSFYFFFIDAVYIELEGSHSHNRKEVNAEKEEIVQELIDKKETFDKQIESQEFRLFSDGAVIKSKEFTDETNNVGASDDSQESDDDLSEDEQSGDSGVDDNEDNDEDGLGFGWHGDREEDSEEGKENGNISFDNLKKLILN